jgi:pre-60S factor REI1
VAFVLSVRRGVDKNSVYNLKRRISSLPPISEMAFHKHVPASDSENNEAEDPSPFEQSCIACEQHYTNRKTWQAHLRSRNHIRRSAENTLSLNGLEEGQHTYEEEQFSPLQCLFCSVESASLDSNLTHMSHAHSFFIPDTEYHRYGINSQLSLCHCGGLS